MPSAYWGGERIWETRANNHNSMFDRTGRLWLAAAVRGRDKAAAGSLANLEIVFERDPCLWDGRFSNNPWLMETPDPLTKLTWDNAALISPATAREMDVENGDVIALEADGRSLEAPVWILPGHANYSVTLNLGYGRQLDDEHKVAAGSGFDAYKLRTGDGQHDCQQRQKKV